MFVKNIFLSLIIIVVQFFSLSSYSVEPNEILQNEKQEKNLIEVLKQNCRKMVKERTGKKPYTNINIARI